MSKIDRIITKEAVGWAMREAKARKHKETHKQWPVITISREYGAGGRSLAKEIEKRTDFKIWDDALLSAIAEEAGAEEEFMASLDERRRKMIEDYLYGSFMGSQLSNTQYIRSLTRVVHTIGEHGKSIIVGRGGNYILKPKNVFRLRIVRPWEERRAAIAKIQEITEKKAEELVNRRDKERKDFIRYYFKHDAENAINYDMVLNSGVYSLTQLVDLVILGYEKKFGRTLSQINKQHV